MGRLVQVRRDQHPVLLVKKCPLCGGHVVAVSLYSLECAGDDSCPNLGKDAKARRDEVKAMVERGMHESWYGPYTP